MLQDGALLSNEMLDLLDMDLEAASATVSKNKQRINLKKRKYMDIKPLCRCAIV